MNPSAPVIAAAIAASASAKKLDRRGPERHDSGHLCLHFEVLNDLRNESTEGIATIAPSKSPCGGALLAHRHLRSTSDDVMLASRTPKIRACARQMARTIQILARPRSGSSSHVTLS